MMINKGIPATGNLEIRVVKDGKIDIKGLPDFKVTVPINEGYILGRSDNASSYLPDIDFLNHEAQEAGVSRRHAVLLHHKGLIQIVDLESINGSFLNGRRLSPDVPYIFKSGDKLSLANLEIIITQSD